MHIKAFKRIVLILMVVTTQAFGQQKTLIDSMAFITGSWRGAGFGGIIEETWSTPENGHMMAMFRMMEKGKVKFMEITDIVEQDSTLFVRVKHFNPDFSGWEERTEHIQFPLLELGRNRARFEGLMFERVDKNTLHITVNGRSAKGPWTETLKLTRYTL